MSTDFDRWLAERRMETQAARTIRAPTPYKPSVGSDVSVPLLQGLAIGTIGTITTGGATLLLGGSWELASKIGGVTGLVAWGGCSAWFVLQHRRLVTEPLDILWERLAQLAGSEPPEPRLPAPRAQPERPPLVINAHRAKPAPQVDVYAQAVRPDIVDLYTFIAAVWPTGDVTRDNCRALGFGRATWEKYVGGLRNRRGRESGRGVLDRAGVVRKTATGWEICATLEEALSLNDELQEYAERQAQTVRLDGTDGMGRDNNGIRSQAIQGDGG